MICSGLYEFKNRTCALCYETNRISHNKCREETVRRQKAKEENIILKFFATRCKYAMDMNSDGEDYIGCTVKDSCDGYYNNCNPMLDSDCIFNNVLEGDNND